MKFTANVQAILGEGDLAFTLSVTELAFEPGRARGLAGRSGSGKSTLIGGLLGVVGDVEFSRTPVAGAVLHRSILFDWLTLGAAIDLEERARCASADWDVLHHALQHASLPAKVLSLRPWEISHGMRQRFEIAKALAFSIEVLYLDEAFSGIDARAKSAVFELIDSKLKQGLSVLFVTHDLGDLMRLSDEITVLEDGRILGSVVPESSRAARIHMNGAQLVELDSAKAVAARLF